MKKCFMMFGFLVIMLILAVITDNAKVSVVEDKFVERELATENEPSNKLVSENSFEK